MTALNSPITSNDIIDKVNELDARDALPSQTGHAGQFLTTDGSDASWNNIPDPLPSQTGNAGKFLTTDGTNESWVAISQAIRYSESNPLLTTVDGECSWDVTHNLNTKDILPIVYNSTAGGELLCDKTRIDNNTLTITIISSSNIPADTYKVVILA